MFNHSRSSSLKGYKKAFRCQFEKLVQVFFILIFLTAAVGVNPTSAQPSPQNVIPQKDSSPAIPVNLAPDCNNPPNDIVRENCLAGNPASEWDVPLAGDPAIQGYATAISVNHGETIHFKVDTQATAYHLDIYRLGYYGGDGARKIATVQPTAPLPQIQPNCPPAVAPDYLVDCGNWAESASWLVPSDAVSGIYIAKLVRDDVSSDGSHIIFIVRNDGSHSDLFFQTSDTTWQAYNGYGDYSLYLNSQHAHKVSYNRPFTTRANPTEDNLFNAEYPMLRWLERNGYDMTYSSDLDTDIRGDLLTNHRVLMSVGHDEYWSAGQRAAVEAARAAGVNLAFFSGNEIYWKTRWEPSTDASHTPNRTLVSYKEGALAPGEHYDCDGNYNCDPVVPATWTGLWRDGCSTGLDGCKPENALSGNISWDGNTSAITVPAEDGNMRFWRNTAVGSQLPGASKTLTAGTLGYEWDFQQYESYYPAGRVLLSTTNYDGRTHHLSLYRASSGALVFSSGTVQWSWGLDSNHDRGNAAADPSMQQATVNLLADMHAQPATLQTNLVAATASTDTTPPTSTITVPSDGAAVNGNVTIIGTAADTGGVVGGVEISVDGGSTWKQATGRENWSYLWAPTKLGSVNIKTRAVDDSGNIESPSAGITVTVGPHPCPCSLWDASNPAGSEDGDTGAVEVGVKFSSDVAGFVSGIRFYKHTNNTGSHIGNLWDASGNNLGSVSFTGETASGWQEADFGTPIPISADTTYVASYFTPTGHYASSEGFFAASSYDNPPLHALQDSSAPGGTEPGGGSSGGEPNGVYKYSTSSVFPDTTWHSANYWVDVAFVTVVGPDITPPHVLSSMPVNNATGIAFNTAVTATFSEAMNATTIGSSTFELRDPDSQLVPATVTYSAAARKATLTPSAALNPSTKYTATVLSGANGVADVAGNKLVDDYVWSFTTSAPLPPPPDEGPGGPILVIADASNASNPFGRYYAEILRGEGFNAFSVTDISKVSASTLTAYDVVLLGEMSLTSAQVTMFDNWVNGGGNLIAFRPDKSLAALYGLADATGTTSEGYLAVNTSTSIGQGVVGGTMQFHGTADNYTVTGATRLATLYSSATVATTYPAIASYSRGSGQVVIFTFDLARSIILMRQGNPAWAGTEGDGADGIRATDMFVHSGQPNWIDNSKILIPQADEQMHVLSHAIEQLTVSKLPLPRLWYFPDQIKGALIMTGDSEGCAGSCVDVPMQDVVAHGGHYTAYLLGTGPTASQVNGWLGAGNGVAVHYDDTANANNPTYANMNAVYDSMTLAFHTAYGYYPTTVRNHWIVWDGWADQAKIEAAHGIGLDTNYYHWGSWVTGPGYFTGSGLPLRFSDETGQILDIFQSTTQLPDETWGQNISTDFKTLIDRSLDQGYYGFLNANFHPPTYGTYQSVADSMMDYANSRGVPIWSAEMLNDFLRARNQGRTENMSWDGTQLKFDFNALTPYSGLTLMIPSKAGGHNLLSLKIGSTPVTYHITTVKGYDYALFTAANGSYTASYEQDTTAPTIASKTPSANATNVSTKINATVAFDEAMDPTTINGSSFSLQADGVSGTVPAAVTYDAPSMTATLNPTADLAYDTLYHVTVSGTVADASNNQLGSDQTWSFTTQAEPPPSVSDTSVADFTAGTVNSCLVDDAVGDGAVRLGAAIDETFSGSGTTLPAGWSAHQWAGNTLPTLGGGLLTVDGAYARNDTLYGPGHTLDFVATFRADAYQHIGFGANDPTFNNGPWIMFSTGADGSQLYVRINPSATADNVTPLGAAYLGSSHQYRIIWNSDSINLLIDGQSMATSTLAIAGPMRVAVSDLNSNGTTLTADWLRMIPPYNSPCTFTSRVFDAGGTVNWGSMTWNAILPTGTGQAFSFRTGNTAAPGASWTGFTGVASSGGALNASSRYLQYQAILSASDVSQTPVLQDITITYANGGADLTPPSITSRAPAPNATGVAANTTATVTFSEAMNPGSITGTTFSLRADGAGSDVPASVSYDAASMTATLNPNANLAYNTLYHVTVSGSVSDLANNPLGSADTWSFTTVAAPDLTPPTITGRTPAPNATDVASDANVTVTFDEAMNAGSITGSTFSLRADGAGSDVAATVSYDAASKTATLNPNANLAYSTLYHVTVSGSVSDAANNPLGSADTWSFTSVAAPLPVLSDTTAADFSAGTLNSCVADATIGDGAVRLPSEVDVDFSGIGLPAGWTSYDWTYDTTTGVYSVSGGLLHVDGVRVNPDPAAYTPGKSLEFVATFAAAANQHIGFGSGSNVPPNAIFDNTPPFWAIFSTGTGPGLMARTWSDAGHTDLAIPGNWLGSSHLYRIDWTSANATYFIDGNQVASQAYSSTAGVTMRPAISDLTQDGTSLTVDSMRMLSYTSPCTFTSRVLDAGGTVNWGTMSWNAGVPAGTSLAFSYRTGNTPVPNGSWTTLTPIASSGAALSGTSRYIQYQADFAASDTSLTPVLQDLTISHTDILPDTTPPTVTGRAPAPNATNVPSDANVTVTFDEAMSPGSIIGTTFSLRAEGAGSDTPAAVTYDDASMTATLNPNANLAYNTLYHVTVSGSVSDLANNPLGSADTWSFTTVAAPDLTPPTITGRTPAPNATDVASDANVTVTFDEAMNAGSITGSTFSLRADGAGSDVAATVSYDAASKTATLNPNANLAYSTLYHVTVSGSVSDAANNPLGSADTWSFTSVAAPLPVLSDTTAADFSAGTLNSCVADATIGDGAVRLPLTIDEGFSGTGTTLPAGWTPTIWSGSTPPTLGGGMLTVNGSEAYTSANYTAGHSLQFVATFSAHSYESVGLAGGTPPLNNPPWLQFGTGSTGTQLYARILATGGTIGSGDDAIALGASYLGSPHTYRIDWNTNKVEFFIDGVSVVVRNITFAESMHVVVSDYTSDAYSVPVDWIKLTPYAAPCTFTSRIFDAGQAVNWETMSWTSDIPTNTAIGLSYRIGSAADLAGAQWVAFTGSSPKALAGNSRYIQYQAALSATDTTVTPDLRDVAFAFHTGADTTAPVISNLNAVPDGSGNASITWNTDEPSDSLVRYGTAPGSLGLTINSATLVSSHTITLTGLTADTTYYYRVTSKDQANNSTTSPVSGNAPASFATPPVTNTLTDTTTANFAAGTLNSCVADATVGDGAVRLPSTIEEGFSGPGLPSGWTSAAWATGGTSTVSGGIVDVDGARLSPTSTSTVWAPTAQVPVVMEFIATFRAAAYQNAGLGAGDNSITGAGMYDDGSKPWAMFGTAGTTNTLYTRVNLGGTNSGDVVISGIANLVGFPHRYRIEWRTGTTGTVEFFVDGVSVNSRTVAFAGGTTMRPGITDYTVGGLKLSVDWLRMWSPYVPPCTFTSRVFDAGQLAHWIDLGKVGAAPTGTSVSFDTRTGDVAVPDGTWSVWQAVNSPIVSPNGRYIQYRATLAATDTTQTPVVESVSLTYSNLAPRTISGNAGVAGATLSYTDGSLKTVTANGAGDYALTLPYGWSGTVTPSMTGYTFAPISTTYTNLTADKTGESYTATLNAFALSVSKTGSGTITSSPTGINCGTTCSANFGYNTPVTLSAAPVIGWTFTGWGGACSGTGTCLVTMDAAKSVSATFVQDVYNLNITIVGSGGVTRDPAGSLFLSGTPVNLTAVPAAGWTFSGWSGDLTGSTNPTSITMDGDKNITATFAQNEYTLSITSDHGTVNPDKPAPYHYGDVVQLTVAPAAGWSFDNWSGDATGTTNPVSVTIDGNKSVTANYTQNGYTLTITSDHGAVNPDKAAPYHYGDVVQLTAASAVGWSFDNWSGDATGTTNPVSVTIDGNKSVTANYTQNEYTLSITSEHGTVNPDKAAPYHYGDVVQLTAVPAAGWSFGNWSDDATGSANPVSVTVDGNKSVTANYTQNGYTLTITSDHGTVSRDNNGPYHFGDKVQLTAVPAAGWSFDSWTGDATGTTNPVSVTMDGNKAVTATFVQDLYNLNITIVGSGAVTRDPNAGLFLSGTTVSLTAVPAAGWTFSGWSGDLTGSTNPTSITMDGDKNITATFTENEYTLSITSAHGTVAKDPEKGTYHEGDVVQLTAAPAAGWNFASWSGDIADTTNPISTTIHGNTSVIANYSQACYALTTAVVPAAGGTLSVTPSQNCTGGYLPGTAVTVKITKNSGQTFTNWSGASTSTATSVTLTMDGNKSLTANFLPAPSALAPTGTLTSWSNVFHWTGISGATLYKLEVYNSSGGLVVRKYPATSSCVGLDCNYSPSELVSLANGSYTWQVAAYGPFGVGGANQYGPWSAVTSFSLNIACYSLTTAVVPSVGGTISVTPVQNCTGGYLPGTAVTVKITKNSGQTFTNWSGASISTATSVTLTMDGNKSLTANFLPAPSALAPTGTLTSWNNLFHWTGVSGATLYKLEVYNSSGGLVVRKYPATGSCVGLDCNYSPSELAQLANGDYTWQVAGYGPFGAGGANQYGPWSSVTAFRMNAACYALTTAVIPAAGGTLSVTPGQNCTGGYLPGTAVTVKITKNSGQTFTGWSGASTSTATSVTLTMDGNKSLTANFLPAPSALAPTGTLTSWSNVFHWTGISGATLYKLEVYNSSGGLVVRKYPATSSCVGLDCNYSPSELVSLANGSYTWQVAAYGPFGVGGANQYGPWSAVTSFSLNIACYSLTTAVVPSVGGTISVTPVQNCTGGYLPGTAVTVKITKNSGQTFTNWSGASISTATSVTLTMDGNKSLTANFLPAPSALAPTGTLTSWNNLFHWTGVSGATLYKLEVYNSSGGLVVRKYPATGSCVGLDCNYSPSELAQLANGDYTWQVAGYGPFGAGGANQYGPWSSVTAFSLGQ